RRNLLCLHQGDQPEQVIRRRWDAGLDLDVSDLLELEPLRHIRPTLVVGDDFQSRQRLGLSVPLGGSALWIGDGFVELRLEIFLVGGAKLLESLHDPFCDPNCVDRRNPKMRVASGVDISHCPRYLRGWNVEHLDERRGVDVTDLSWLNSAVPALRD